MKRMTSGACSGGTDGGDSKADEQGLFDELPSLKIHVSHFGRERAYREVDDVQTIKAAPIHHTCSAARRR
jgi:hypothetical protein